jgi:hypothetical protein
MQHGCGIDDAQDRDDTGGDCPESGALQASKPEVHHLAAAEYSLGALDFAAPALSQNHKLSVNDYILAGPLDFSAPTMLRGIVHWGDVGGKPPKISDDLKMKWIAAVEQFVIEKQGETCVTIFQSTSAVVNFAQSLAKAAGITVSDTILIRQVIGPAVRSAKDKLAKN